MEQNVIDTHAHYWPDAYLEHLKAAGSPDTDIAKGIGAGDSTTDIEKRLKMMDDAGVQYQLLSATPQAPQWGDADEALDLAKEINNAYADLIQQYPDRFLAYGAVPLPHIDEAIAEGKRAIEELGFLGIGVNTLVQNKWSIADERFFPFFEAMDKLGAVIYIHPTGQGANSDLVNDFGLEWVVGAPIEDMLVTLQLLKAEIPQRFPHLKFHIAHLGGGISFQMQRIQDNYTDWNAFAESPIETLKEKFWFDAANFSTFALENSAQIFGAERLLMGSDFPYFQNDKYTRAATYITDTSLSDAEKAGILRENVKTLHPHAKF